MCISGHASKLCLDDEHAGEMMRERTVRAI